MNSSILGAALGMAVIFAAFALLASGLQEVVASLISLRGRTLINALNKLGEGEADKILNSKLLKPLGQEKASGKPVVRAADDDKALIPPRRAPSYIPSWLFAATIVQRAEDALSAAPEPESGSDEKPPTLDDQINAMNGPLGDIVKGVWNDVDGNAKKAEDALAKWYDSYMERVSGWYKRKSRYILFFVGLLVCIVANVDAISLTRNVLDNSQIQTVLAQKAPTVKDCAAGSTQVECALNAISNLPGSQLGLFWVSSCTPKDATTATGQDAKSTKVVICSNGVGGWFHNRGVDHGGDYFWKIVGLILGAFAISLGAPFWFDLIGRGVALKGAGQTPTPASSTPSTT